jgi:hypothetical protein
MATTEVAVEATQRAVALGPLLMAIGREIAERTDALALLLVERQHLPQGCVPEGPIVAECARQRCELRRAHQELERLGCRLVSLRPQIFRVEVDERDGGGVLLYCPEDS